MKLSAYFSTATALVALSLTGCDSKQPTAPQAPAAATQATSASAAPTQARQLQDFDWHLQAVTDKQGQAVSQISPDLLQSEQGIVLRFNEDRLVLDGLCNHISSGYKLNSGKLELTQAISTMKACPESALMMAEQYLAGQLAQLEQHSFEPAARRLSLQFADGSTWQLQGELTLSAQYGAPETVFYEIKAAKIDCPDQAVGSAQCFNAREIQYNEQGIKIAAGEWQAFTHAIDGYQHRDDTNTILRLHRYRVNDNKNETTYKYVLDMPVMVESVR